MTEFNLPRGTMDFLPHEVAHRRYVEEIIRKTFESFGFQEIQTPIFEELALLAARSGEEIREGPFHFLEADSHASDVSLSQKILFMPFLDRN